MKFSKLCEAYVGISETTKRLEKTSLLADLLSKIPEKDMRSVMMLLKGRVYPEWDKTTLGISQKLTIKAIALATGIKEQDVVKDFKKLGDLGEVAAKLVGSKKQVTLVNAELSVDGVMNSLRKIATLEGLGSVDQKLKYIAQLLGNSNPDEARFLIRILLEDLRIGIADGTIRDAVVWWSLQKEGFKYDKQKNSWEGDPEKRTAWQEAVQNAIDRSNDVARVAVTAKKGLKSLQAIDLTLGVPTKVMLAQRETTVEGAFSRVGRPAALENKYDGFRLQIHKDGTDVTLFTRRLENVTLQFPDIVTRIRELIKGSCILDAEVVGYNPKTKRHTPFQQISQRIKRKYDIEKLTKDLPVEVNVFDIMFLNGKTVYQLPFEERRKLIEKTVPKKPFQIQPSEILITDDDKKAEKFYKNALDQGFEGLMFKTLNAPYKPGSRVGFMVKLKPTLDTLDLAVVGAEWGEGKRSGWLTSFTVACQDENGQLVEIGKVGTGFKELEQEEGVTFKLMTDLLKEEVIEERGKEVELRPKVVLEIKFEEVQKSPSYGSGFALRFPRVVRVRSDRRTDEISTVSEIKDMYEAQRGKK